VHDLFLDFTGLRLDDPSHHVRGKRAGINLPNHREIVKAPHDVTRPRPEQPAKVKELGLARAPRSIEKVR